MSRSAGKVKVEVEIDPEMLEAARASGTDVSRAAEEGLRRALPSASRYKAETARRWREDNAEAIEINNRYVEEHGMPLAQYRRYPWPDSTPT